MVSITAEKRELIGKRVSKLRNKGQTPAVLYGPKIKEASLTVNGKQLEKIYREAGESTLIDLDIAGKKTPVLIHDIQRNPVSGEIIHVDFYQPRLDKKVTISVPLAFEGEAPGIKELGGTLLHSIQEIEVQALPQNLPHEIKVSVESLETFEDKILVKDIILPPDVEISRDLEDLVAQVVPVTDVEKELEKPVSEEAPEGEEIEEGKEGEEEKKEEPKEGNKAEKKEE